MEFDTRSRRIGKECRRLFLVFGMCAYPKALWLKHGLGMTTGDKAAKLQRYVARLGIWGQILKHHKASERF